MQGDKGIRRDKEMFWIEEKQFVSRSPYIPLFPHISTSPHISISPFLTRVIDPNITSKGLSTPPNS